MRVIVTGGTGFIGRALCARLVAAGHDVTVLSRAPERAADLPRVRLAAWDGVSVEPLGPLLAGAAAVVHLAGESIAGGRWTAARKRRIRASRVDSSAALAAAILALPQPPAVLLQASAVGYYGSRGDEELDESSPPGEGFLAEVCRQWEAASAAVEDRGVRRPLARTGVVLAPGGGALPAMARPVRWFCGGPLGGGRQWLPWIHLDDELRALLFLLEHPTASGPFNLTAPQPLRQRAFVEALGRVLSRPSSLPAPELALRLALGEMSELLLASQRVRPARLLELGFRFRFSAAAQALGDLLGGR